MYKSVDAFMKNVISRSPGENEFHQAVHEVITSIWDYVQDHPQYIHEGILDRIIEPERVILFRVPWRDDRGKTQVNRVIGWSLSQLLVHIKVVCVFMLL